jgi:hypothetical protein
MYVQTLPQIISTASVTAVCAYAGWRGGATERWGALLTFLDWMLTPLAERLTRINEAELAVFALDALYLSLMLTIALRSRRFWPLFAVGFYMLEVLMHIDMLVDHKVRARPYFVGMEIWSYLSLFALAAGVRFEAGPVRRLS